MTELEETVVLANRVLERPYADPDDDLAMLARQFIRLREAVAWHHGQKADDRCIEDDDRLYAAAGLPPCDRRVGDKTAMLENCKRFIERRCEGGGWPSYAELELQMNQLKDHVVQLEQERDQKQRNGG